MEKVTFLTASLLITLTFNAFSQNNSSGLEVKECSKNIHCHPVRTTAVAANTNFSTMHIHPASNEVFDKVAVSEQNRNVMHIHPTKSTHFNWINEESIAIRTIK